MENTFSCCLICDKSEGPVTYSNSTLSPELIEERSRKKGISALVKLLYLPNSLIDQLDQAAYCYTCINKLSQLESIYSQLEFFQGKVVQNRREIELELIAAAYRDDQQGNSSSATTTKSTRKIICDLIQGKHDVILTKSNDSIIHDESAKKCQDQEVNETPPRNIDSPLTIQELSHNSSNPITIAELRNDNTSNYNKDSSHFVDTIQNGLDSDGAKEDEKLIDSLDETINRVIEDGLKMSVTISDDQIDIDEEDEARINKNHIDSTISKNANDADADQNRKNKVEADIHNFNVNSTNTNEVSTHIDNAIELTVIGNENINGKVSSVSGENAENEEIMPVLDSFMNNPIDGNNDGILVNQIQGPPQLDYIYLKVETDNKKKHKKYERKKSTNSAIDKDLSNNQKGVDEVQTIPMSLEDICRTKQAIVLLNRLQVEPAFPSDEEKNDVSTKPTSTSQNTTTTAPTPTALPIIIKRGRGRPRKDSVVGIIPAKISTTDNQFTSTKSEGPVNKKKRKMSTSSHLEGQQPKNKKKSKMSQREINGLKLSKARDLNVRRVNNSKQEVENEEYLPISTKKVPKIESTFRSRLLKMKSSKTSVQTIRVSQNYRQKMDALTRSKRIRNKSSTTNSDIFVRKSERIFLKTDISPSKSEGKNNLEEKSQYTSTSNIENGLTEQTSHEMEDVVPIYSRKSQRIFHQNQKQDSAPIPKPAITRDRGQISPDIITFSTTTSFIEISKKEVTNSKTNKSLVKPAGNSLAESSKSKKILQLDQPSNQESEREDKSSKKCNNCSKNITSKSYSRHSKRCLKKNLTSSAQITDDNESLAPLKKGSDEIVKSPVEVEALANIGSDSNSNELEKLTSSINERVNDNENIIVASVIEEVTSKSSEQIPDEHLSTTKKRGRRATSNSSNSNIVNDDSNKMLVRKTKAELKEFSNIVNENESAIQGIQGIVYSTSPTNLQRVIDRVSHTEDLNDIGSNIEMNNQMDIQDLLRSGVNNDIMISMSDENERSVNKSTESNDTVFSIIEETSFVQEINLIKSNNTEELVESKDFVASNGDDVTSTSTETESEKFKEIESAKSDQNLENNMVELVQSPETETGTHNSVALQDSEIRTTDDNKKTDGETPDNLASTESQKIGYSFRCPYTTCPILFPDKTQLIFHLKNHLAEEEAIK